MRLDDEGQGAAPDPTQLDTMRQLMQARDGDQGAVTARRLDAHVRDWRDLSPDEVIARLSQKRGREENVPETGRETKTERTDPDVLTKIFGAEKPQVSSRLPKPISLLSPDQVAVQQQLALTHGPELREVYSAQNFTPPKLKALVTYPLDVLFDLVAANQFTWLFLLPADTITAVAKLFEGTGMTRLPAPWIQLLDQRSKDACDLMLLPQQRLTLVNGLVNACDIAYWLSLPAKCVVSMCTTLPLPRLTRLLARPATDVLQLCAFCQPGTLNRMVLMRDAVYAALMDLSLPSLLAFASLSQRVLNQLFKHDEAGQLQMMTDPEMASLGAIQDLESEQYTPQVTQGMSYQHSLEEHGAHLTETDVKAASSSANKPKGQWASAVIHEACIRWALTNCSKTHFFKSSGRWTPHGLALDANALRIHAGDVGRVWENGRWRTTHLFRVVLEQDTEGGFHVLTAFPV